MADPNYCYPFQILCQPLSWWSSAASWAQAILSVLAIYWAARIAMQQHRRDLYQRVSVIRQLVSVVTATAAVNTAQVNKCVKEGSCFETDIEYFDLIVQALKAVPLHDLPDEDLTHVVAGCAKKSAEIGKLFQYLDGIGKGNYPATEAYGQRCTDLVKLLWNFSCQAHEVQLRYQRNLVVFGMPGYWQWRRARRTVIAAPTYPTVEIH